MAVTTTPNTPPVRAFLAGLFTPIARAFAGLAEANWFNAGMNKRLEDVQKLQALSDKELAARGIKRDDIVRHVFRDLLHAF